MAKIDRKVYIIKAGVETVHIVSTFQRAYNILFSLAGKDNIKYLKSYEQYTRDINKNGTVLVAIPYFPTYLVSRHYINK